MWLTNPILFSVILPHIVTIVEGHGRLVEPPSRSTMWRYGFPNPPNYNDNELYCGGVDVQWDMNDGKCGVCGDPWQGPRDNEAGGKYANGIIVRKYQPGEIITVGIELTANHYGYFEFRLCPNDNPFEKVTQECFNKHLLKLVNTGKTKFQLLESEGIVNKVYKIQLKLPYVRCSDCVLQWKYNAGNSWGVDLYTGEGCIGCGAQEQFYGCADIAIGHDEIHIGVPPESHPWYFENYNDMNGEFYYWGLVGNETWNGADSMTSSSKPWNYGTTLLLAVIALRGSYT